MPHFMIKVANQKGKTWEAVGKNPKTGNKITISGGQAGVQVGPKHRDAKTIKAFSARHGEPKTAKQYINKLRWQGDAKIGSTVNIPSKYFK